MLSNLFCPISKKLKSTAYKAQHNVHSIATRFVKARGESDFCTLSIQRVHSNGDVTQTHAPSLQPTSFSYPVSFMMRRQEIYEVRSW